MYNLLIAIGAGLATLGLLGAVFGAKAAAIPALVAVVAAWLLAARRTSKQLEAILQKATAEAQAQRIDKAVALLKSAYPLARWQIMVKGQLDAQIGVLLYIAERYKEAEPYLEKASVQHWLGRSMWAVRLFRHHKLDEALEVFEKTSVWARKEALFWGVWTFVLVKAKKQADALQVLARGIEALPDSKVLKTNQLALQNGKPLDMSGFGEMWYSFRLEKPPRALLEKYARQMGMGVPQQQHGGRNLRHLRG